MSKKPKIEIRLNQTDKTLEFVGWIAVLGIWFFTLLNYSNLPDIIPTHFNGAGQADGFGTKSSIVALPFISTLLFIGLTFLNKYPHNLNYPTEITEENALHQYTNATRLMRVLKLVIVIIFGVIVYKTVQSANGNSDGLGAWFLPFVLAMIFAPILYFLIHSNKNKSSK